LPHLSEKIDEQTPMVRGQCVSSPAGPKVLDKLIEDGAITQQERAAYVTDRGLP